MLLFKEGHVVCGLSFSVLSHLAVDSACLSCHQEPFSAAVGSGHGANSR